MHYMVCYAEQNGTQETGTRIFTVRLRLVVSHEMENKKYWTAIQVDSASTLGFGNLGGAEAFLDVNFKCKQHHLFCRESKSFIYREKYVN